MTQGYCCMKAVSLHSYITYENKKNINSDNNTAAYVCA